MERYCMTEHDEQCALFEWAHYQHPELLRWMFAIPNGGQRNKIVAARLKQEGVKKGVPDLMLPMPTDKYHGLFIEMKFGKNKMTEPQKQFFDFATQQGYLCKVAYSADEAIQILSEYLGKDVLNG